MKFSYLLPACLALLLTGCSPVVRVHEAPACAPIETPGAHYPVTIENLSAKGEAVTAVYDAPPQRVVAVWQNSIETLLALGVGDRIVAGMGVPNATYIRAAYRAAYEAIPYTSLEHLDVETVLMMEPDLIVGWGSTFSPKVLRSTDFWTGRGIHTYIAPASVSGATQKTLTTEWQDILNMGRIFDRQSRAEEIVAEMQREISFVTEETQDKKTRPRALVIEFLGKEIRSYGQDTLAGDMLRALGAAHLAADGENLSMEELITLDPDAIFVVVIESDYGNEEAVLSHIYDNPALQGLHSVRERRIYPLPLYAVYSAGVRSYDGILILAQGLYPELYKR